MDKEKKLQVDNKLLPSLSPLSCEEETRLELTVEAIPLVWIGDGPSDELPGVGLGVCTLVFPELVFGEGLGIFSEVERDATEGVAELDVGQVALGIDGLDLGGAGILGTGDTDAVFGEEGAEGGLLVGLDGTLPLLWSFLTDRGVFSSASVAVGTMVVGWTLLTRARYRLVPP